MMHKIKQLLIIASVGTLVGSAAVAVPVGAIDLFKSCNGKKNIDGKVCEASGNDSAISSAQSIINTLLLLIGIVATIMIVIGGFRYVTSYGDQNSITAAKNTILYAVIGLVVAILASLIVRFVVSQFN